MAGIRQISKEIRTRCPHCHRSLDLSELGPDLFRRILERLKLGERVDVEKFGKFRVKLFPARRVEGLKTHNAQVAKAGITYMPEYWRIYFKATVHAKAALNEALRDKTRRKT